MKKRSMMMYVVMLVSITGMSTISIISMLLLDWGGIDYVLTLVSICVTCILGVTTYQQVNTQLKLDLLDKTPFITCEFERITDDELEQISKESGMVRNEVLFFSNKRYLCVENLAGSNVDALLRLPIVNSSDVPIKKVNILYKLNDETEYEEIRNYRAEIAMQVFKENIDTLKSLCDEYEASPIYAIKPRDTYNVYFKIPFATQKMNISIKLEIETVHGYNFEQTNDILLYMVGFRKEGIIYLVEKAESKIKSVKEFPERINVTG